MSKVPVKRRTAAPAVRKAKPAVVTMPAADTLAAEIRQLIAEARATAATAVNANLTLLYWRVGLRIRQEVLRERRAAYGEQIVSALSSQLSVEHGPSFSVKNLQRMIQFAEVFPDERIVVSLIRQLSWSHIIALIPLKQPMQREF